MTKLHISLQSFSYKKGIPPDLSGNGGGFVFDCRGLYNPGRIESYKTRTGLNADVQEFLETQTKMPQFLSNIFQIIDLTLENYLERGFEHLQISFGCTGGQHRSVYATETLEKYLKEHYTNIIVEKKHCNKENWVKKIS